MNADPLLQFDLKFDSLKIFLNSVTTVVNQHANILNVMQTELKNKTYIEQVNYLKIIEWIWLIGQ